jgi:hypothetical protein
MHVALPGYVLSRSVRLVGVEQKAGGPRIVAYFAITDIDVEDCPNCGGALKIIAAPSSGSGQGLKIRR